MKWINHKLITLSVATLMSKNPIYLGASFIGSTFPDVLEGNYGKEITFKNHRQRTHWFVPYVLLGLGILFYKTNQDYTKEMSLLLTGGLFFVYGCLMHLFLDALTGTIPGLSLKNTKKRWGKKIIKNDLKEFLVTILVVLFVFFVHKARTTFSFF